MTASTNIAAAAKRIVETKPEDADPFELVNIYTLRTEADAEAFSNRVAAASEQATTRHTERTITAKTNIGLAIFAAAIARCKASEGELKMPEVKIATVGKLGAILSLTDSPVTVDGVTPKACVERFGYKLSTLNACVDLARGVIGSVDDSARAKLDAEGVSITERSLRTAILAEINPDAIRNRAEGAATMDAAKLALVAGRKPGAIVKVKGNAVKVDAEALNKIRNATASSKITPADAATMTDDEIDATLKVLNLVKSARAAGQAKAPKVAKPKAVTK